MNNRHIACSPYFVLENSGKRDIKLIALCGGKHSALDFRISLKSCVTRLDFKPCLDYSDFWIMPVIKLDGNEHYDRVLLHTDDSLFVSNNSE